MNAQRRHRKLAEQTGSWCSWTVGQWFTNSYMAVMVDPPFKLPDMSLSFRCSCEPEGEQHPHPYSVSRLCVTVAEYRPDRTIRDKLTNMLKRTMIVRGSAVVAIERDEPLIGGAGMRCYAARVTSADDPNAWYAVQTQYVGAIERLWRPDRWAVVQPDGGTLDRPVLPVVIALRGKQGVGLVMPTTCAGSAVELARDEVTP